ncbi:MAG: hypothetical protein AAFR33_04280 [Pseudomonadota bacterium]
MKASIALAVGAFALLAFAAVGSFMASGVGEGGLPRALWIPYGLGAVLTILVGGGLFALSFHSSRAGYDDIDRPEDGPDG